MKVVSFDIWRTLFRPNAAFSELRAQIVADCYDLGLTGKEFRVFITEACKELDAATNRTGVQYGFAPRIRLALKKSGFMREVTDDSLYLVYSVARNVQLSSVDNMPTLMEPDLPETFRRLTGYGLKLAVISNTGMTEGAELSEILDALGLGRHLTYRIYSDEVGVAKPSDEIFKTLQVIASTSPSQILHVGDSVEADLQGAQLAGLQARLYDPAGEHPELPSYGLHSRLAATVDLFDGEYV